MAIYQEHPGDQSWRLWQKAMTLNEETGDKFHCPKPTGWTPTSTCVPVSGTASDGAQTWQSTDCSGIVGDLILRHNGTFQIYPDTSDEWESSLLHKVEVLELIQLIMEKIQQDFLGGYQWII
eukprot:8660203-Ditylum_brightwellii.AAC.1